MNDYISAGISRGVTISLLYPLDTLKTRLQNNNANAYNLQLYNGYRIALFTQIPYGMLVFGTYEKMKQYNKNNIINAIFSDFCGSLFLSPCEVIKQNIQIGKYKTIYEAIKYENKRMYKGYSALLLRDVPFRAIQLPLYDKLKNNTEPNAIYGAIAGMTAGFLTNPIDVIKTKLMCIKHHTHVIKIIPYIYKTEGFLGFFKGIIYRTIYLGLSSSIFFIIYEKIRRYT